jgi:hypothetical protein
MTLRENRSLADQAQRLRGHADVSGTADALVATLRDVEAALSPVIGQVGFDALYLRCVHLTGRMYPWLAEAHDQDTERASLDLAVLTPVIKRQSVPCAAAGGAALLESIDALLSSLMGRALTDRLLESVGADTHDMVTVR